ncbi:TPA: hypothetical protein ACX3IN_004621 [Vibrio parahaemolyticus]
MTSINEAVKDAAIANINEDLYEITKQIEALPEGLQQYVEEVKISISHMGKSLEKALDAVPETFDHNITDNLTKALEVAETIEKITQDFNVSIKRQQLSLQESANAITELHKRELDAMKSEHQKAMRVYTAEQKQLLESAVEEAANRSDKAVNKAEAACNDIIKKFEDHCVVPISWLAILPLGGGVVGAVITLLALLVTRFFY